MKNKRGLAFDVFWFVAGLMALGLAVANGNALPAVLLALCALFFLARAVTRLTSPQEVAEIDRAAKGDRS